MQDSEWQRVVELAAALNASEELQAEFHEDPRLVLERYSIEVTDEELAAIRRVIDICSERTTGMCAFPLAIERGRIRKGGSDDGS